MQGETPKDSQSPPPPPLSGNTKKKSTPGAEGFLFLFLPASYAAQEPRMQAASRAQGTAELFITHTRGRRALHACILCPRVYGTLRAKAAPLKRDTSQGDCDAYRSLLRRECTIAFTRTTIRAFHYARADATCAASDSLLSHKRNSATQCTRTCTRQNEQLREQGGGGACKFRTANVCGSNSGGPVFFSRKLRCVRLLFQSNLCHRSLH